MGLTSPTKQHVSLAATIPRYMATLQHSSAKAASIRASSAAEPVTIAPVASLGSSTFITTPAP